MPFWPNRAQNIFLLRGTTANNRINHAFKIRVLYLLLIRDNNILIIMEYVFLTHDSMRISESSELDVSLDSHLSLRPRSQENKDSDPLNKIRFIGRASTRKYVFYCMRNCLPVGIPHFIQRKKYILKFNFWQRPVNCAIGANCESIVKNYLGENNYLLMQKLLSLLFYVEGKRRDI